MYHQVIDNDINAGKMFQPGMCVTKEIFEKQLAFLKKNYNIISLEEYVNLLKNQKRPPKKAIVITFDDGWKDNFSNAFPILTKYKIPATIFLTTNFIDTGKIFWFTRLSFLLNDSGLTSDKIKTVFEKVIDANKDNGSIQILEENFPSGLTYDSDNIIELMKKLDDQIIEQIVDELTKISNLAEESPGGKKLMLSWNDVEQMNGDIISFGSHGQTHRIMTKLEPELIRIELEESKRIIENKIKTDVNCFAFPNGNYNTTTMELVKNAGYHCALTTGKSVDNKDGIDLFSLPRINIHSGISIGPRGNFSKSLFAVTLSGAETWFRRLFGFG